MAGRVGTGGWGTLGPSHIWTPLLCQDLPSVPPGVVAPESSSESHLATLFPGPSTQASSYHRSLGLEGLGVSMPYVLLALGRPESSLVEGKDLPYCFTTSLFSSELHDWEPRATATPPRSSNLLHENDRAADKKGKMVESRTLTPSRALRRFSLHSTVQSFSFMFVEHLL